MNELHIEPTRPEDAGRRGDLYVASRSAAVPFLTEVHGPAQMRVWLRDVLLPRGTTWVARSGDRIVGFVTLDGEDIDQLYLDPLYLRRGIGSALIAHAKTRSPRCDRTRPDFALALRWAGARDAASVAGAAR